MSTKFTGDNWRQQAEEFAKQRFNIEWPNIRGGIEGEVRALFKLGKLTEEIKVKLIGTVCPSIPDSNGVTDEST